MSLWYFVGIPAWIVVILTAGARLADLGPMDWKFLHHLRRLGLSGAGVIGAIALLRPFITDGWYMVPASPVMCGVGWSWAAIWLTTEGMPPWWDYILGVHRDVDYWKQLRWRERLAMEWRALRASFKPRRMRAPAGS